VAQCRVGPGYRPIAKKGAPALERSRLSHVFQNYVRPETLAAANPPLVARQAGRAVPPRRAGAPSRPRRLRRRSPPAGSPGPRPAHRPLPPACRPAAFSAFRRAVRTSAMSFLLMPRAGRQQGGR